jgi:hypothetical protein
MYLFEKLRELPVNRDRPILPEACMRILLVEDDATTAASIELMLRKESFICDITGLGEDALEIGKLYDYEMRGYTLRF